MEKVSVWEFVRVAMIYAWALTECVNSCITHKYIDKHRRIYVN